QKRLTAISHRLSMSSVSALLFLLSGPQASQKLRQTVIAEFWSTYGSRRISANLPNFDYPNELSSQLKNASAFILVIRYIAIVRSSSGSMSTSIGYPSWGSKLRGIEMKRILSRKIIAGLILVCGATSFTQAQVLRDDFLIHSTPY